MLTDDPEAPTTIKRRFNYGAFTGGRVKGSVVVDGGSIESIEPAASRRRQAAATPEGKQASNFLVAAPEALVLRQLAGGDGPAARLLLPGDRPADRTCTAPASRRRAWAFRVSRCTC